MKNLKTLIIAGLCFVFLLSCQSDATQKEVVELTNKGWDVIRHPGLYIKPGEAHSPIAFGYFEQALNLDSTYSPALAGLADRYVIVKRKELGRKQRIKNAKEYVQKALKINSELHLAYMAKGRIERQNGDHKTAIRSHEKAVNLAPDDAEACRRYADMKIWSEGNLEEALELAEKAVQLDPRSSQAKKTLAMAYRHMDRSDKGLEWIDQALNQCKFAEYFFEKGIILFMKKEYDTAIEVFNEGLSIYPERRDLKISKGRCFERTGRIKEAVSIYKDLEEAWIMGWAYSLIGDRAKVQEILDEQKKNAAQGASNAMSIAWTYLGLKEYDNVVDYMEKGMEQAIENGWFGSYRYWINHVDDYKVLYENTRFQALLDKVNSYRVAGL